METSQWIIIAVVVVVLVALAAWLVTRQRAKKQHEHAEHLRQEAQEHATQIPETQVRAKEAEAQAERAGHEDRLRTADQVDPRVDTTSDDYSPGAGARDPDTVLDADDRRTDGPSGTHRA